MGPCGAGSVVAYPTGAIYGEAHIHLGATSMISPQVTLTAGYSPEQTTVPPRALVIGDRAVIGVRSAIIAHESITIGDDVWFGPEVFVTDANHGYQDPEVPIGRQLGLHEPVQIGSGSWLGCRAIVLPGTRIGRQCVIAAGSVVRGDIPDHSVVAGVPGRILRQYRPGSAGHASTWASTPTDCRSGSTPRPSPRRWTPTPSRPPSSTPVSPNCRPSSTATATTPCPSGTCPPPTPRPLPTRAPPRSGGDGRR